MWTLLVEDFHAKILALQDQEQELLDNDRDYGGKCLELYGLLDLNTSSLKTVQLCFFEVSSKSYATFPKSGIMQNGNVYRMRSLDTHTKERDYLLLPTPTRSDRKAITRKMESLKAYLEAGHQIHITHILLLKGFAKSEIVSILELIMGFPIGHTELEV